MHTELETLKAELTALRMLVTSMMSALPPAIAARANEAFRVNHLRGRIVLQAANTGRQAMAAYDRAVQKAG